MAGADEIICMEVLSPNPDVQIEIEGDQKLLEDETQIEEK